MYMYEYIRYNVFWVFLLHINGFFLKNNIASLQQFRNLEIYVGCFKVGLSRFTNSTNILTVIKLSLIKTHN